MYAGPVPVTIKDIDMMKRTLFFPAAAVCAAVAVTSCGNNNFTAGTIEIAEKIALADGRTDSLDFKISAEFPRTGLGKEAGMKISSAITEALFGEEYMSMDPEAAAEAYKAGLENDYRETNLPMLEVEGLQDSFMGWTDYTEGKFTASRKDILSYTAVKYTYTGGAHGMTSEVALNFDRKTGDLITEENFFKDGYVPALTKLLTRHLPEALDSPADTAALFLKEIEPNGNFSITDSGITYIFNQYEIAPYSMGIIRISIPWEEIEGL